MVDVGDLMKTVTLHKIMQVTIHSYPYARFIQLCQKHGNNYFVIVVLIALYVETV